MKFVKDKIRMVFFGLIIVLVLIVYYVKGFDSVDFKLNGKEYFVLRDNGNKSKCFVINFIIIDFELERGNWYICRVIVFFEFV